VKFGFLLRQITNIAPRDHLQGKWYYSTNDYQSYQLQLRYEELFSDNLGLDLYFRYKKRPRESFHGIGNESRKDKEASYTLENTEFRIQVPYHSNDRLYVSGLGHYLISNLTDGRDPDLNGDLDSIFADPNFALDPGRLDGSRYVVFGAEFEYDGRSSVGRPSGGSHVVAQFSRYLGVSRSDGQNFCEYTLDVRHYLHVWLKRILALRLYAKRFDADDGTSQAMPIHLTSSLGGIDALRGYSRGRFIDNDVAVASMEYRYPIWDVADAFVFLDQGRVFGKITNEKFFSGWKWSAGFGLRVWSYDDVLAMVQVARSDESTRAYFELGATW
jgi:outer membrane protein assembly factor BamA